MRARRRLVCVCYRREKIISKGIRTKSPSPQEKEGLVCCNSSNTPRACWANKRRWVVKSGLIILHIRCPYGVRRSCDLRAVCPCGVRALPVRCSRVVRALFARCSRVVRIPRKPYANNGTRPSGDFIRKIRKTSTDMPRAIFIFQTASQSPE